MDIEKHIRKKIVKKCLLAGIILPAVVAGISSLNLTSTGDTYEERQPEITREIVGTGEGGTITDEDLRNILRDDLRAKGYREERIYVSDDELLSLHEKEFGVRGGRVYTLY